MLLGAGLTAAGLPGVFAPWPGLWTPSSTAWDLDAIQTAPDVLAVQVAGGATALDRRRMSTPDAVMGAVART